MKKITAYTWAFILVLITFFTVGMCTLGSTKSTGKSLTVLKDETVYYELETATTVDGIYINVGAIHATSSMDATITVKTSTSSASTSPTSASWTTFGSSTQINNYTSTDSALYNWVNVGSGYSRNSVYKVSFTSNVTLDLNEIIVVNTAGEIATLKPSTKGSSYDLAEVSNTVDKQENFARFIVDGAVGLNNGAFENFAQEEGYYMSSVQNVLAGNAKYDAIFNLDGNFNYLATVLMVPSVALFGNSVFALRLPAFIATCMLIVFAFMLIKELTKREQFAFYFSLVLMLGGLATTVGRLGAPYVMVASAIVGSACFMYRFFAHGISNRNILSGAMNIFAAGLFGAFAVAMDIMAILPIAGVAVIYVFGLRRQKLAHEVALSKLEEEKAIRRENNAYETKTRLSYGFAALSFGMGAIILILFSAVICYSAYVRAMNNTQVGFISMLWRGIAESARDNGVTAYTATNASVLSWIIPFKPAALFTGVVDPGEGAYVGWHVLPNVAVLVCAAAAFITCTVKVIVDLAKKKKDKQALRMRRAYIVLFGGMVLALGAGLIRGNVSALSGMLFHVLYLGFLPLVATLLPEGKTTQSAVLINVGCITLIAVFAVVFALAVPAMYGYAIMADRANLFNWMSLYSNGFFK